jgi:hypothetical protein
VRVVALGIYPERRRAALDAGAHAFVLKDAGYDALCAAITGADVADAVVGDTHAVAEAVVGRPAGVAVGRAVPSAARGEERVLS